MKNVYVNDLRSVLNEYNFFSETNYYSQLKDAVMLQAHVSGHKEPLSATSREHIAFLDREYTMARYLGNSNNLQ